MSVTQSPQQITAAPTVGDTFWSFFGFSTENPQGGTTPPGSYQPPLNGGSQTTPPIIVFDTFWQFFGYSTVRPGETTQPW